MLDVWQIQEVSRLAKNGWSNRRIAQSTGVSRGSVNTLVKKQWVPEEREKQGHSPESAQDHVRCPTCGALVTMPCVLCGLPLTKNIFPEIGKEIITLGVELSGDEHKRYQEIKIFRDQSTHPHFVELPHNWPFY